MSSGLITLVNGPAQAVINPQGARILGWGVGGRAGLYFNPEKPNRTTHFCSPPFSALSSGGTLTAPKDKRYMVEGQVHELAQHGFLRDVKWSQAYISSNELVLEFANLRNSLDREIFKQYPFFFRYLAAYRLTENELFCQLSFTNLTLCAIAPVDLASHTYHPLNEGWVSIPELMGLPYRNETNFNDQKFDLILKDPYFASGINRDWHFDTRGRNRFNIYYPDGTIITLKLGNTPKDVEIRQLVVWTNPAEGQFICVEPVARGRNALNLPKDHPNAAICVFPSQTVSLSFSLAMNRHL